MRATSAHAPRGISLFIGGEAVDEIVGRPIRRVAASRCRCPTRRRGGIFEDRVPCDRPRLRRTGRAAGGSCGCHRAVAYADQQGAAPHAPLPATSNAETTLLAASAPA